MVEYSEGLKTLLECGVATPYENLPVGCHYVHPYGFECRVSAFASGDIMVQNGGLAPKPIGTDDVYAEVKQKEIQEVRADVVITETVLRDVNYNEMFTPLYDRTGVFIKLKGLSGCCSFVQLGDPHSKTFNGYERFLPDDLVRVITLPTEA